MELRLACCELELARVELCRSRGNGLGVAVDLIACERFARKDLRFSRRDQDLASLHVGKPAEALALVGETAIHPLLLRAQLLFARAYRRLALLEQGEAFETGGELLLAPRDRGDRRAELRFARRDDLRALLEVGKVLDGDAQLCLAPLEIRLCLPDRSFPALELAELRQPGLELFLAPFDL